MMMRHALLTLTAALALTTTLLPGMGQAKSVKWYCVALDPAHPEIQTCYPSTARP